MTLVPLSIKVSNHSTENLNMLFTEKGEKLKFSARVSDLPLFIGNGTKVKIPSEIKQPLILQLSKACKKAVLRSPRMWVLKNQFSPSLKYLAHLSGFLRKKRPNLFNYSLTQERLHIMSYIIMNYDIKVSSLLECCVTIENF